MMTMTTTNVREKGDEASEALVHQHKNPRSLYHIEQIPFTEYLYHIEQVRFTEYTTSIRSDLQSV